ncbi:hypothetical protein GQ55_9G205200 [Panicum hallii var. hallii]|uniref:C2H2-type domain-containing protein n=1 Tax=Panicum hallii var. hallii TaxID=1504633 RepID=A0A2T7C5E3_9POAL|nr:hypothetical protein GQ55_9G205200 [Panicum hallii var. hallii]
MVNPCHNGGRQATDVDTILEKMIAPAHQPPSLGIPCKQLPPAVAWPPAQATRAEGVGAAAAPGAKRMPRPGPARPAASARRRTRRHAPTAPSKVRAAQAAAKKKPTVPCAFCGVLCMTAWHLEQHEKGRKHRNKVAYLAGEMNVQCPVCDVHLSGALNVEQHFAGKQHIWRLKLKGGA